MRALYPALAALLGLAGALAATLFLFRGAQDAIDRVLDERLRGAGETAALLLGEAQPGSKRLAELMRTNALDGAYLLSPSLAVLEDAAGGAGQRADLLRVDADRVRRAFAGEVTVAPAYEVGDLAVTAGYFPVRAGSEVRSVLALEAGREFLRARVDLRRARDAAVLLSLLSAVALALVVVRWSRSERARAAAAQRAVQSEAVQRMAAMVAHEIRNPLGVIRGTVELMRERSKAALTARDQEALQDVLAEVERMRRLTDDFLDLGAERPLTEARVDVPALLRDAAQAAEAAHPGTRVRIEAGERCAIEGDEGRLRQVLANLLSNAAQSQGPGEIVVQETVAGGKVRIRVRDSGPGVPAEQRAKLFDPFFTTRPAGTGLGLAIARRLCERHGGTLSLLEEPGPGAVFEIALPAAKES